MLDRAVQQARACLSFLVASGWTGPSLAVERLRRHHGQEHERARFKVKRRLGANPRTGFRQVLPGADAVRRLERWYEMCCWYAAGTYWKHDEEKQVSGETRSDPN